MNFSQLKRTVTVRGVLSWFWGLAFLLAAFTAWPDHKWPIGIGYALVVSLVAGVGQTIPLVVAAITQSAIIENQATRRGIYELHRQPTLHEGDAGEYWSSHLTEANREQVMLEETHRAQDRQGVPRWLRAVGAVAWEIGATLVWIGVVSVVTPN